MTELLDIIDEFTLRADLVYFAILVLLVLVAASRDMPKPNVLRRAVQRLRWWWYSYKNRKWWQ